MIKTIFVVATEYIRLSTGHRLTFFLALRIITKPEQEMNIIHETVKPNIGYVRSVPSSLSKIVVLPRSTDREIRLAKNDKTPRPIIVFIERRKRLRVHGLYSTFLFTCQPTKLYGHMRPAFFRVTYAPFLFMVLIPRVDRVRRMDFFSSGM